MKFLCVSCDEGMKLEAAGGPHEGSLQATFVCPRCHYRINMLTNPWETQLVQTLGVQIGGRTSPVNPYEQVLSSLALPPSEASMPASGESSGSGCPFADMFGQTDASSAEPDVRWSDAAKLRIERIPSFIRPMVQRAIERYAAEQGHALITDTLMDEARARLGM
jgi:hypothetical protein